MDSTEFSSLHSWGFGWELLEPINKATSDEHEIELSKSFSSGQKALYFYWYLDGQVTNGGFVQFYWNGYDKYEAGGSKKWIVIPGGYTNRWMGNGRMKGF